MAYTLVFANLGANYGTAKIGVIIYAMNIMKETSIIKGLIPIFKAAILNIYWINFSSYLAQKLSGNKTYNGQKEYQICELEYLED